MPRFFFHTSHRGRMNFDPTGALHDGRESALRLARRIVRELAEEPGYEDVVVHVSNDEGLHIASVDIRGEIEIEPFLCGHCARDGGPAPDDTNVRSLRRIGEPETVAVFRKTPSPDAQSARI